MHKDTPDFNYNTAFPNLDVVALYLQPLNELPFDKSLWHGKSNDSNNYNDDNSTRCVR